MKNVRFKSTKQPVWTKKLPLVRLQTTAKGYHQVTMPEELVRSLRLTDNTVFEPEETTDGNILFKPIRR